LKHVKQLRNIEIIYFTTRFYFVSSVYEIYINSVKLQCILQHVLATYVAIFRRYKQESSYNYKCVRTIPPLMFLTRW
jgi:hypothetical protein